jgi:hypothetical protein
MARLAQTESETRRLSEAVRLLDSERERLRARIASLERSIEDITGSIQRQSAAAMAPPAAPVTAVAAATIDANTPMPAATAPEHTAAAPAVVPSPQVATVAPATSAASETGVAPEGTADRITESPVQPAVGADVGGATNFDGLRTLWNSTRKANAASIEGLHPLVAVRETARGRGVELRLIVGPLADPDTAGQFCAALATAKRPCRIVAFEGQELALVAPESPRRPPTAPRSSVRPKP